MAVLITGSIATDHLMTFPGRFADSLVADKLDKISLSFLVEELEVRRGGVAPNIAFGMGCLGLRPVLVGAVGPDFADYESWLQRHNVDTSGVRVSESRHTARFVCTTDSDQNQIASFYPGAMSEARNIELRPVVDRVGKADVVLIGANDPEAMLRHTEECRFRGYAFAADPSQQLARMGGEEIVPLVEGARYLFTNEYESALIQQKTGWTDADLNAMVEVRITTLGAQGARVQRSGEPAVTVPVAEEDRRADPTGVGDAFRAGYLAGQSWGLQDERSAQLGALLATYVIETIGTQEYELARMHFLERMARAYGDDAAAEVEPHVICPRP
ncbi:MAG TPA: carbohydrate kinase family protein [Actinobacteria bacterium]|nr:carbohydrate kinase family protein [Actinomycetota bacterium]